MKKLLLALSIIAGLAITPLLVSAQVSGSLWKVSSNSLLPITSSWSLTVPQLGGSGTSCVQVNNAGLFSVTGAPCGSGGGSSTFGTSSLSAVYPLIYTQSNSLAQFSTAFTTTTNNTFAGTQFFNTASTTNLIVSSAGGNGTRCLQVGSDGTVSATAGACGVAGAGIQNLGPLNQLQSGTTQTLATSSAVTNSGLTVGLTIVGSGNTQTFTPTFTGSISGLTTGNFSSANISQWTNNSGYVTSSFSTTSANYWQTQNNFFSTTSAAYWQSVNNFFSTTSASYFLSQNQGPAFSTTSASYFLSQNQGLAFSTTSAGYWQSVNNFFSTTSANYWKTQTTFTGASTTLLGDSNTFSGANNTFTNTITGSISGNAGTVTNGVYTTRAINTTFPLQGGGTLAGDLTLTNAFSTTSNTGLTAGNLYVGSGGILQTAGTTTASCSGTVSCSQFTILGTSPVTINGSAGTAASTTLLTDQNTWTGLQRFLNAIFTNSTTTAATTTNLAITGITSSLLSTNAAGAVVATSSVSTNYITGVLPIVNGGTNQTSYNTNGVIYGNSGISQYTSTAQGGANTVLVANGGAPSFSNSPTIANLTVTGLSGGLVGSNTGLLYNLASSTLYGSGTPGQVLSWNNGVPQWVATTTFTAGSNITLTQTGNSIQIASTGGGASFSYPFTVTTNFGSLAQATTGIPWFQKGEQASTTSWFDQINVGSSTSGTLATSTFAGNVSVASLTDTGLTAGSIPFITTGGTFSQNNAKLFWDGTNSRLGVITSSPGYALTNTNTVTTASTGLSPHSGAFVWSASGLGYSGVIDVTGNTAQRSGLLVRTANNASTTSILTVDDGTNNVLNVVGSGQVGISTTSPYALLSISDNPSNTNLFPFVIASSSASASSTLFSVDNTGSASTTKLFGATLSTCDPVTGKITWANGFFGCGTDQTGSGSFGYPFPGNATTSAITFGGLLATNATTTAATTTNLAITSVLGSILKTNAAGAVVPAISNTDYQAPITLTTTGSSGAATFNGTTLNIPNYTTGGSGASTTLLTDFNTFSNTQTFNNVVINGTCTGSGCSGGASFSYPFFSSLGTANATSSLVGFTGGLISTASSTFSGGFHAAYASTTNMEMTLYADNFPGADIGAQVNNAYAALPSTGGTIVIPSGSYSFSTQILFNVSGKNASIVCGSDGLGTTLTYTGTATSTVFNTAPANSHPSGWGMDNCNLVGPQTDIGGATVGIEIGGSIGATGWNGNRLTVNHFTKDITFGNNTYQTTLSNSFISNATRIFSFEGTSNSGESMRFTNVTAADGFSEINSFATALNSKCINIPVSAVASLSWNGGSVDDCSLFVDDGNENVSFFGVHWENPGVLTGVVKKYNYITNQGTSNFNNLNIFGGTMMNDASTSQYAPDFFITNSGKVKLYGLTVDANGTVAAVPALVNNYGANGSLEYYGITPIGSSNAYTTIATSSIFFGTDQKNSLLKIGGTASTTNLTISGVSNCSGSNALTTNASGVVACGAISGGGSSFSYPFNIQSQFGQTTAATSTLMQFTGGLTASSTSHFTNFDYNTSTSSNISYFNNGAQFGTLTSSNAMPSVGWLNVGTSTSPNGGVDLAYFVGNQNQDAQVSINNLTPGKGAYLKVQGNSNYVSYEITGTNGVDYKLGTFGGTNFNIADNGNNFLAFAKGLPQDTFDILGSATGVKAGIASSSPFATLSVMNSAVFTNQWPFAIGSSTPSATSTLFAVDRNGNNYHGGLTPTLSAGTFMGQANDSDGLIKTPSGANTTLTMTFGNPFLGSSVSCIADFATSTLGNVAASTTPTTVKFTFPSANNVVFNYHCFGTQ